MSKEIETHSKAFITKTLSALVITCALAAVQSASAAAQTASKLDCKDCVKSKQIENGKIKGKDLKDETIEGSKIEDGAISMSKLSSDVTALGMSGIANLPPSAFVPLEAYPNYETELGVLIANNGGGAYCVGAPVPLPDGAVVNEVEAYVIDNSSTQNIQIGLTSYDPTNLSPASATIMATLASSGAAGVPSTLSTTSITDPTVDLATRFYVVGVCLPDNTGLLGARVYY